MPAYTTPLSELPSLHLSHLFFLIACTPVWIHPDAILAMPGWKYAFSLAGSAVKAATPPGTVRLIGMASSSSSSSNSFKLPELTVTYRAQTQPPEWPLRRPRRQVPDSHRRPCRSAELGAVEEAGVPRHRLVLRLRRQLYLGVHRTGAARVELCLPP